MTRFLEAACYLIIVGWVGSAVMIAWFNDKTAQFIRTVFAELKPIYVPTVVVQYIVDLTLYHHAWYNFNDLTTIAWNLYMYYVYKDTDDDDRWKRRRKKLADKVRELGGKLTVEPAGA